MITLVKRRFFCKTPTKTVGGKWRMFCFLYEITEWSEQDNEPPFAHIGTTFGTKEDLLMLTLTHDRLLDYKKDIIQRD